MVQTTGGPELGASVVSPAMTSGAVLLLQEHLTEEEKNLWTSLGTNWTSSWSVCLCLPIRLTVFHSSHRKLLASLFQLGRQYVSSTVLTCLLGWLAASGLWLSWPAVGRSHPVTAQTGCSQRKQADTKSTGTGLADSKGLWGWHWWSVSLQTLKNVSYRTRRSENDEQIPGNCN